MSVRLKAIYKDGAFVPVTNGEILNVPENTEVELTVHDPYVLPAKATTAEERERALRELIESSSVPCPLPQRLPVRRLIAASTSVLF